MRISDWSSDVCSSDLLDPDAVAAVSNHRLDLVVDDLVAAQRPDILVVRGRGDSSQLSGQVGAQRLRLPGNAVQELTRVRGHIPDRVLADRQHRAALRQRLERVVRVRTRNRSEEHTSELQSLMRISYAVF